MTISTAIWDQSNETMDREELAQLQLERLQATVFRAYRNVAFYRKRFDGLGLEPEDIQSLDDLRRLPFTTREDLHAGYPYDLLAVPLREVVRLHSASWQNGCPTVCAFTRNDLRHWNDMMARILTASGVTRDDVVQIFFGQRILTSGLGFHGGAERIGASVIPALPGSLEQQISIMQDFKTTAFVATPAEAVRLTELLTQKGLDIRRLSLRAGLLGGEPWSERLRAHIEEGLGIIALDNYGLSELGGPGIAAECPCKTGLHLAEDHFYAEIINPATGQPVNVGEEGELVLTTLTKEALPLLRLRTHDLTRLDLRHCECGRTFARLARISARTDSLVYVQGVQLSPDRIETILADIEGALPHYQIILDRKEGVEEVEILVELLAGRSSDSLGKVLAIEQQITDRVHEAFGLTPKIRLVEPATIARLAGEKPARVIDRRE